MAAKKSNSTFTAAQQKQIDEAIQNGLCAATGFGMGNFPQNQGFPGSEQVEQADTIFKNLRYYLVSNFRQILSQAYVEIGIVQTLVDLPVDDALRGGVEIKSKQLDEDQIQELLISLDRDDDVNTVGQAAKWNRLFGGAGVLILTDQDPEEPLDVSTIGEHTPLEFRAVDMWELFWDKQNTEGYDPAIQTQNFEYYNYYAENVHKSRVMRMKGITAPSFIRPRLRGWGFSVVEVLVRSINQYLKATSLGFEVLDEFKLDIYKIKNLVNTLLSPNGMQKVNERVRLANWQKNYQNAVVMDSEDDFDHKQLSFAGLAEAMAGIRMQVASDTRFPITKLFGQSVSPGLGSTDQNDMENYNSMVESQVRSKIKFDLLRVCEIKCQKMFGMIPDDLSLTFKPLRVLSAEQEENVKTQKFTRVLQAKQAGELSTIEFRDACNKGNLFDITLDTDDNKLNPDDPQVRDIVKGTLEDTGDDVDDPGANRADTRKPRAGDKGGIGKEPPLPKDTTAKETKPAKPVKNEEDFDESKHPRGKDGKFGVGGSVEHTPKSAEIERLREEAEKAEDGNSHHEAEALREKARELEKKPSKKKAPKDMTDGEIKKAKSALSKKISAAVDDLMDAGYGHVKQDEIRAKRKQNPLFDKYCDLLDKNAELTAEVVARYGEGHKLGNTITVMPEPFTQIEKIKRAIQNSPEFDRASYAADGGDAWIDPRRQPLFENPGNVDEALWAKAKEASQKAFGKQKWQFVVWFYKKSGGHFT